MLDDAQAGPMRVRVQSVEHVGCFARCRRDDPGVHRAVLAGVGRVEHDARVDAVLDVAAAGPARRPARKYGPPGEESEPPPETAARGCLWWAPTMGARAE